MSMAMLGVFLLMIASTSTAPTPGTVYLVIKLPDNLLPAKKTQGKMLDIWFGIAALAIRGLAQ